MMTGTVQLVINADGTVRCIYVEADLSPVGGPMLGPFSKRSQALNAEQDWLNSHWLPAAI